MKMLLFFVVFFISALPVQAEFVLQLPLGAKETYSRLETGIPPVVPISPYNDTGLATVTVSGDIRRSVWSFGGEQTLAEVQEGILQQLRASDYEILFFCQTRQCGGFDFRFAVDVVPEPEMRVDLRDFRFISARLTVLQEPSYVTFMLSKSPESVYVQMTEYSSTPAPALAPPAETQAALPAEPKATPTVGPDTGFIVLEGLEFESGSAKFGSDPLNSLAKLAEIMKQDPAIKVLLVGHSDMSGSLGGNIAISTKRAQTIRKRLIQKYSISADRISAHGVGFLAPRASNETKAGRKKNRRVEAVFSR